MAATTAAAAFGTVNFVVMALFVAATLAIGVFYGLRGQDAQGLLISRDMNVAPVSLSMMATFMSAILIIGTPSEIFYFGMQWFVVVLTFPVASIIISVFILPVFYRMELTSVYEYLGKRYNTRVMTMVGTVAFMMQNLLYTGIALFAPTIVLSNVTGMPIWAAIVLVALLGTSYTAFGGYKAVVWADVLQACVMVCGVTAIIVQGCINVGGFSEMLDVNRQHGRLTMFTWDIDPLQRYNFWNTFFGQIFVWISLLGVNQPAVQRLLSLPTLKQATLTSLISSFLIVIMVSLSTVSGLAIFATYSSCDPLRAGVTSRRDELVPHFVADQLGHVPGLGGLFIACVLSGALSTISSSLNSLAAVTWEDFFRDSAWTARLSEAGRRWVLRGIALVYGIISMLMAFVAKNMGGVIQVATGVYGGCTGPILAMFVMGLFMPFTNPKGVTTGLVLGLALSLWISFGASFSGAAPPVMLPSSADGCSFNVTITANVTDDAMETREKGTFDTLYSISYMLYAVIGFVATMVTGILVSLLTGGGQGSVDEEYLSPAMSWHSRKKKFHPSNTNGASNDAYEMGEKH
ncbi:sodium-coupled monocarboxylate transporter 1-like [Amphibalanus amphitrite]|uniref:sodium-coupled monocarboxylate transporter 1-like n=1 Tax=Amphibalanus amphitrite TaxID=1232801 RepID=UPI001C90AC48|nr:sodium-coupled monocarboxylate transporter 1-like [Amphibalanus amphitrite]XP_043205679.1 sodium-coupled monocarboxylate transporter 1-like [Amphibalanus amphitrite]